MPTATTARRMFELLEPICLVTFMADECNEELAAPPYDALSPAELDELIAELEPITATLVATGSQ
ncbi:MAG TPA: hypothetical protein VGG83_23865 [Trebonia sp.]|jgi:hypothetical protein